MVAVLDNIFLIELLHSTFLVFILIQVASLLCCIAAIIKRDSVKDIYLFMDEYWKWDHLQRNLVMLSLWFSSVGAYITLWVLTSSIKDIALTEGFQRSPFLSIYVYVGLLGFFGYTLKSSQDRYRSTIKVTESLKHLRKYRAFKQTLKNIKEFKYSQSLLGSWVAPTTTLAHWLSEHLVRTKVDKEMQNALVQFMVVAALEYLLRMSLVAVAIYISIDKLLV